MATESTKANGSGKSNAGKKRVIFAVEAPGAKEVFLCGNFNGWDGGTPMKAEGNGSWKATVMLSPGTYEYRIKVDGHWVDDPAAQSHVSNPFGSRNCVRTV
jgi:1,4-alpha-glucan branching enzyme